MPGDTSGGQRSYFPWNPYIFFKNTYLAGILLKTDVI